MMSCTSLLVGSSARLKKLTTALWNRSRSNGNRLKA